jgi:shikimate dehydrogenase
MEQQLRKRMRVDVSHHALRRRTLKNLIERASLVINASSMGMDRRSEIPIEGVWLRSDQWVMDIVYRPLQTRLLTLAERAGARTINGLDMLVGQGACSFELWTGEAAPITEMRRALAEKTVALVHADNN